MRLTRAIAIGAALALGAGWVWAQTRAGSYPETVWISLAALPSNPVHAFVTLNGRRSIGDTSMLGLNRQVFSGSSMLQDLVRSSKNEIAVNLEWGEIETGRMFSSFVLIDLAAVTNVPEYPAMVFGFAPNGGYLIFWRKGSADAGFPYEIVAVGCGTRRADLDGSFAIWIDRNAELIRRVRGAAQRWADTVPQYDLPDCARSG